ncbi:unnamed protein product [Rotaria magnacalcarata]|uniref:Peptidase S1 domain-containing protein n=1 Tax=Rotaria magnacalcarata TaxID=392030 RepID=A0A816WM49_9BILA|nr:unnamed protein product [Rotaria magnacalcarata]CAF2129366.1 unnamed protein product [Rotaria magnacalcarata]CAF3778226.1 unnamed protein product [Rotaria magnacalcarata]
MVFNILFLSYIIQLSLGITLVDADEKSKHQRYQSFFNGPQSFYQQHQMTNIDTQKWYYSSNQKPLTYSWYWTNQDVPSSNFLNSLASKDTDPLSNRICGKSPMTNRFGRIMGGQDAVPHSYPWMVSLTKRSLNNLHLCGGVLITRLHVLTAAHCMEDFDGVNDLNIIAGTHYSTDKRNPAPVIAITVHPQYDADTFANDIAIVTLRSPLPDNDQRIGIICLPPDDIQGKIYPPMKISGVAIGWGSLSFGGNPSTTLKQVVLPILDASKWPCSTYITYLPGQICAGQLQGGADTCQADSGGPLMIENADSCWEIIGITSFGKSCGKPNTPGIYTRVATYNSFIRSIIGRSNYSPYYSSFSSSSQLCSLNRFLFSAILFIVFF